MLTNGPSMVLTEVCWRRNKTGNLGAQALDARMLARESLKEIGGKRGISLVSMSRSSKDNLSLFPQYLSGRQVSLAPKL